jgi:TonB family protein
MWESLGEIFSWTARGSLYAVGVIFIIVLVQILMRRALSERWSYALWMILLARLVIPVGPEWEMSLWNLAPHKLMHWMKSDTAVIYQAQPDGQNPVWTQAMPGGIPPASGYSIPVQENAGPNDPSKDAVSESASAWSALLAILPAIWLAGALAVISGIVFSNLRLWRSVRGLRFATDSALLELFEDCRQRMRVRTTVGLVVTARVKSPLLFGFFRPRVLVPEDFVRQIPAEQLRYIFLHELAHLKRQDILVGWLLAVLQALHWFNPLVWWAFARMRFDRELACDASVLARVSDGERRHYGGTLIGMLERFSHTQHMPAVAGILENGTQLKRRLTMITKFRPPKRLAGIWGAILIVVLSGAMLTEASSDAGEAGKSADELAVEQTLLDMLDALNRNDFDRWEEFYVQDDSFSISGFLREPVSGFEKYKNILKQIRSGDIVEEGRSFSDIKVRVSGDTAWATLRDQFVRKIQDNKGKKVDYHDVFTLVKHDGRWLINNISQTEQNVKYVTQYTIIFSNGLRLETYFPSSLSKATTGGFALQKMVTRIVDPVYPEVARKARLSGEVVFLVTFDKDGSIIHAIRRLGDPILANAAATAMRQWKAAPMLADIGSITFPVQFVFHPDGSVDIAQTVPTLGVGSIKQDAVPYNPVGFPKPEDFLIGEPPDGLAALSEEARPIFVAPTEIPRDR